MPKLNLLDSNVVYRNPYPGHQAVSATHPFVLPLSEKELICTFGHGQAMYARDRMTHISRSPDGGKTWVHEGPTLDRSRGERYYQYGSGAMTLLKDGSIVLAGCRTDRTDPSLFYVNPETGGSLELESFVMRSFDGGRTWLDPLLGQFPAKTPGTEPAVGGPVIVLKDGRWMLLFETWPAYETRELDIVSYVVFSSDEGRTWGDRTIIADGRSYDRSFSHGHITPLSDGRYLAMFWTGNANFSEFTDMHWSIGDPTAARWTKPKTTGLFGQSNYPVEVKPGQLALIYSHRERTEQPGIKVILSNDGGETWDDEHQVVVWDAYGKESLGVARSDRYPSSHDVIAYGAPHLVRLNERELLASFWCTQSCDTHVRCCRLRIAD